MRLSLYIISFLLTFTNVHSQHVIKYSERPNGHNSPYRISINEILTSPDVYEGTHLEVVGYLRFEDMAVYPSKSDFKKHQLKKSLRIEIDKKALIQWKRYNNQYVFIDAVFDANNHGHINLWKGALKDITSIKLKSL